MTMDLQSSIMYIYFGLSVPILQEVLNIKALDKKYEELSMLKGIIGEMRDRLNTMLAKNPDPLCDEVLSLSKALDDMINRYTELETELKSKA